MGGDGAVMNLCVGAGWEDDGFCGVCGRDALGANGCDFDADMGVVRVVEGEGSLGGVCLG